MIRQESQKNGCYVVFVNPKQPLASWKNLRMRIEHFSAPESSHEPVHSLDSRTQQQPAPNQSKE